VSGSDDPTKRKRFLTFKRNFDWHLVGRTTDAAALYLKARTGVFQRAEEQINWITFFEFLGDLFKRAVDDALGKILLAALHDDIDEMRYEWALVAGIWNDLTFIGSVTA